MADIRVENCLDTMASMESASVDLVVTSPPYDNLRTYNGYSFDFESIAKELARVLKPGGVIVWVVGDATIQGSETGSSFRQALFFKELGLNLHDTMIWQKANAFNFGSNNCYRQSFEYMFVLSKGKPKSLNFLKDVVSKNAGKITKKIRNYRDGSRFLGDGYVIENFKNATIFGAYLYLQATMGILPFFPEQLAADHIITWSNLDDLVYDPFTGSGTTGLAAKKLGRRFIGSEISADYAQAAIERINNG